MIDGNWSMKTFPKAWRRLTAVVVISAGFISLVTSTRADDSPLPQETVITVDTSAKGRPISPLIYGVCFGKTEQLRDLNFTLNRQGGNNFTRYNWRTNTVNLDSDWYFESIPGFFLNEPTTQVPGQRADSFIEHTQAAGAQPMITIPMIGWVAKVTPQKDKLYSFSVAKYGAQQKTAPGDPDAGNGIKPDGVTRITGNDPNDACQPADVDYQRPWVEHLVKQWGAAAHGGLRYYIMDNEPGLWHETHRDVHPVGFTNNEYLKDFLGYAAMVKSVDPSAQVVGPEEWGWPGFAYSGFDAQYRGQHGYQGHPDQDAHGGMPFMPWLLSQIREHDEKTGQRLLDVFTFHMYPQGGDQGPDVSPKIEILRNRSTRSLWDPNYKDESWINDKIMLIPRMRGLVDTYYPGTKIGITEYNWGAEKSMSGATAQADVLGIFGREGVDLATRWTVPPTDSPAYNAMKIYRNYDGKDGTFGDLSVSDSAPDCDDVSSFAALRRSDGALTVMVINKQLDAPANVKIAIAGFDSSSAEAWQIAGDGSSIKRLADVSVDGGVPRSTLPSQSVTLFVLHKR